MKKNYHQWHQLKTYLNNRQSRLFFHEREIWHCNLGINIGFEQDGKGPRYIRPVIILKKFNHQLCWVIPLTRTIKEGRYYYTFSFEPNSLSTAILSQIRLLDVKRLANKIGYIDIGKFDQIKQKLKQLLE